MSTLFDDDAELFDEFTSAAFCSDDVRAMERPLLDEGVPLMRMAASATAMTARVMMARAHVSPAAAKVVLLAGGGDNGGDGLFAAAELAAEGVDVTVVATGKSLHEGGFAALRAQGADLIVLDPGAEIPGADGPQDAQEEADLFEEAINAVESAHLVIDAMTGIGLHGALRGIPAHIAAEVGEDGALPSAMASVHGDRADGFPLVLAVDTPSGVGVDDGTLPGAYIPADVTVMFGALKPCALLPPAAYVCGQLALVDFGFETEDYAPVVESISSRTAAQSIRMPHIDDSKYSRGVTGLVTGSEAYPGAAVLSSLAASQSNVGMIRYVGPDRPSDMVLREVPEAVLGTGHVQAWAVGSGVPNALADESHDDVQRRTIAALLAHYDVDAQGSDEMPPVVVDAGALDLLPESCVPQVLITPHAGELARLLSERDEPVTVPQVLAAPLEYATRAWEITGATVLLKGAATIVVGDDGEGNPRAFVSGSGPAWLATAGAGDVLAGTLGSVLAQNAETLDRLPDQMAVYAAVGAYIHGVAAAMASGSLQRGLARPVVYDAQDPVEFFHAMMADRVGGADSPFGPFGHPITATDVAGRLAHVFGALASMYDDGGTDADDAETETDEPDAPLHSTSSTSTGASSPAVRGDDGIVLDADRDYTDEELDALADALFAQYEEDERRSGDEGPRFS
ncbi:bifunctional ADP-dependent NAD(P)H-hydrate dehydratase/NAD(P)H-hydrate epimerase [Bifidobacterium sp. 82T24]|uniref:bifunctional ADP-dependent NAD(P)H-hydrate dehydratase/NAD(P)H-hydrate epimerase n=1 Tax=Bifidobacterium pluvialisilvae TaxID=2834436 RepID=UPI001C56664B|nr:bifunctional ADP-dependent NAD(P)H-hydrate dehydratase/NAD(P)H-hydrate epimerase [Bifidobacterium pluvialisilvae]MBW3087331.1 bifunctional ADP-dependent NAD(P)H-hydrate dehydratase/NAD(P)H-hydrate epimerase [Bifidobacterium pluvialisilvae]